MVGIRPAKTCRDLTKVAWTRFSKRKPRKSYVKSMPHTNLLNFRMGNKKGEGYDTVYELIAKEDVQLRDNSLEAGRQSCNKYLEKTIPNQYYFHLKVVCHNVIRENKMIAGAGADRLQKGMRASFGRPTDRAARIKKGQSILTITTKSSNKEHIRESMRRMTAKLSKGWRMIEKPLAA
ncbi:MAG: 50S ribosomal protein L16 [Candidatus Micrarchaeia archaeon]